jgi:hypothetical protein
VNIPDRHPATQHIVRFFHYEHVVPDDMRAVSKMFHDLAERIVESVPDGPELTTCLRKLLEAKDCGVRALLEHGIDWKKD